MNKPPVALVCYNRPAHLAQVLNALSQLDVGKLYVFSDGPKGDADRERVEAVRDLLFSIRWTTPTAVMQPQIIGLARSVVGAVDYVLGRHETVVVLEDDCVPGPHFYGYMTEALERYRDEPRVASVSGYAYRLPPGAFVSYEYDAFFFPRIETWGWATWRDRWSRYVRDADLARVFGEASGLELGGADVPRMVRNKLERGVDSWSPGWLVGTAGMLTLYPVHSHVHYIGDDGSGANMPATGRWATDMADGPAERWPAELDLHWPAYRAMRETFDTL
jgi:hypothetical protein